MLAAPRQKKSYRHMPSHVAYRYLPLHTFQGPDRRVPEGVGASRLRLSCWGALRDALPRARLRALWVGEANGVWLLCERCVQRATEKHAHDASSVQP